MSKRPLVSIITPCYNGETFVRRHLDSILAQTYSPIEFIFVNDGSTDRTEEIVLGYQQRLEERGIEFRYVTQENRGVCGAINAGLPLFRGDYLMVPNSDDWMDAACVERQVNYLEAHPDQGVVICRGGVVPEDRPDQIVSYLERKNTASGWLFDDLIFGRDIYFGSAGWMSRASMFLEVRRERQIYENRVGQTWQLYLPLLYKYECGIQTDVLWFYLHREDSLGHQAKTFQELTERTFQYEDILRHVLAEIDMPKTERESYLQKIKIQYIRARMGFAVQYHERGAAKEEYENLLREHAASPEDRKVYLRGRYRLFDLACTAVSLPVRAVRKLARSLLGGGG